VKRTKVRMHKKPGRPELVRSVISLARLPQSRCRTPMTFDRRQLVDLESYLRHTHMLIGKLRDIPTV